MSHYESELASICNVDVSFIEKAIEAKAFPQPSYILKGNFTVQSHIYSVSNSKSIEISFFPKSSHKWLLLAMEWSRDGNLDTAAKNLRDVFEMEYLSELRLRGVDEPNDLKEMFENTWKHFLLGTYGVCVLDSSKISNIVSKQFAAKRLRELTENGQKRTFNNNESSKIMSAIEDYNKFAASFGHWEYEKTSRKHLVDDIRKKLHSK